jgi:PleD family two-component response regulator
MALVLCTGIDEAQLQARRLILERAGHRSVSVTDAKTLTTVCEKYSFDVAVIGQAVSPNMKRRIASLVRQHCPDARILELCQPNEGKVLTDADSWLNFPADVAKKLADRVDELAQGKRRAKA